MWGFVLLLAATFAVRLWVGDLFTVVSSSMEPTLRKGDRVWVRYGTKDVDLFSLLAYRNAAGDSVVKRLGGLPNQDVMVDDSGDLWIDGKRPVRGDFWVPIFDDSQLPVSEHFSHGTEGLDPWVQNDGVWEVDARSIPTGHSQGLLRLRTGVDSGQLNEEGLREFGPGKVGVGDVRLRMDLRVLEPGGILRLELTEQSDRFQLLGGLDNLSRGRFALFHWRAGRRELEAASILPLELQTWTPITFLNRDNRVEFWVGDTLVIQYEYESNEPHPLGSIGERVLFGGTGARLAFQNIRIDRDVTYTARGGIAVGKRLSLGPDQYFMLGDNSPMSEDSRVLGPISRSQLIGEVRYRLLPRSRAGSLLVLPGVKPAGNPPEPPGR